METSLPVRNSQRERPIHVSVIANSIAMPDAFLALILAHPRINPWISKRTRRQADIGLGSHQSIFPIACGWETKHSDLALTFLRQILFFSLVKNDHPVSP